MTYDEMFQAFKDGKISEEVWYEYCNNLLIEILNQNVDVLVRLMDR